MIDELLEEADKLSIHDPSLRQLVFRDLAACTMTKEQQQHFDQLKRKIQQQSIAIKPKSASSLDILKEAQQTLYSTEDIARDTLSHLSAQGEQMQHQQASVRQVQSSLSFGNKLLSRISSFWRN